MSTPAENIKDLLVSAGVGVFAAASGWAILINRASEKRDGAVPDTTVTVADTGGFDDINVLDGTTINQPTVQVLVRGAQNGEVAGMAKAREVRDALVRLPVTTVDGNVFNGIWGQGNTAYLGHDEQNRPRWSMNFRLAWTPA